MYFSICHQLIYRYSEPVCLLPHWVRLRPRCDLGQRLVQSSLEVSPPAQHQTNCVDLEGNALIQLTFDAPTTQLTIMATSQVETLRDNPFAFLLEPWATQLPLDYPSSLRSQLSPYLDGPLDPEAVRLGQDLAIATDHNVLNFLAQLNQTLYAECSYQLRETGAPWPPGVTWRKKSGSCRDVAVLFMAVCRAMGLAARFVSGYQAGDTDTEHRHLHAWAEVYLPGAGWRGYDPTHGLAVTAGHVALVATVDPAYGAAVSGGFRPQGGGSQSVMAAQGIAEMTYDLQMQVDEKTS